MTTPALDRSPVAVIGGGPVGLVAAAHLASRGQRVKLYEAGPRIGTNVRDWGHVRVFTPWRYCVDALASSLLERHGWRLPPADEFPTGDEFVGRYLEPLAATAELSGVIETDARVAMISRLGVDKVVTRGREDRPFILSIATRTGVRRDFARAVLDASGTWLMPNPLGADGLPAEGEAQCGDRIAYGIPDVLGRDRPLYAGCTTLVVGAGYSAANALLDLERLAQTEPSTRILWATRGTNLIRIYGGGSADQLPARGELGAYTRALVESDRVALRRGFATVALRRDGARIRVEGETVDGLSSLGPVDRIIAATGQRPDVSLTRELRVELDPWLESTKALGPLIDPNEHFCGSVPPHGYRELAHPERDFYTVGVKSYGRAPTFLLLTGYEQVRSIAAALAGDLAAAADVRLVLPQTGVCTTSFSVDAPATGCCGAPAPSAAGACCLADALTKQAGGEGCGCGAKA